jgi:hypothetical protein
MKHPILEIVRQSNCPKLSWLHKPGERVRYYRFVEPRKGSDWHEQWIEIPASEAYEIAERYDKENGR